MATKEERLEVRLRIPDLDVSVPLNREDVRDLCSRIVEMDIPLGRVEKSVVELVQRFVEKGYSADELSVLVEKNVTLKPRDIEEDVVVRVFPSRIPQAYVESRLGANLEYTRYSFSKERNEVGNKLKQLVKPYFDFAYEIKRILEERLKHEERLHEEDDY
jgi:hypothetical protein